jgi:hypothetical protein
VDPWPDPLVYDQFHARCAVFPGLEVCRGHSPGAAAKYADGEFDLVYLDGDHRFEPVLADIRAWRSKARRWLAGHDFSPTHPDVMRAVRHLLGEPILFSDASWLAPLG